MRFALGARRRRGDPRGCGKAITEQITAAPRRSPATEGPRTRAAIPRSRQLGATAAAATRAVADSARSPRSIAGVRRTQASTRRAEPPLRRQSPRPSHANSKQQHEAEHRLPRRRGSRLLLEGRGAGQSFTSSTLWPSRNSTFFALELVDRLCSAVARAAVDRDRRPAPARSRVPCQSSDVGDNISFCTSSAAPPVTGTRLLNGLSSTPGASVMKMRAAS